MKIKPDRALLKQINDAMPTMWDLPDWSQYTDKQLVSLAHVELTDTDVHDTHAELMFGYDIRRNAILELAYRKIAEVENED